MSFFFSFLTTKFASLCLLLRFTSPKVFMCYLYWNRFEYMCLSVSVCFTRTFKHVEELAHLQVPRHTQAGRRKAWLEPELHKGRDCFQPAVGQGWRARYGQTKKKPKKNPASITCRMDYTRLLQLAFPGEKELVYNWGGRQTNDTLRLLLRWWWWLFPGFWENVQQFIPRLPFFFLFFF